MDKIKKPEEKFLKIRLLEEHKPFQSNCVVIEFYGHSMEVPKEDVIGLNSIAQKVIDEGLVELDFDQTCKTLYPALPHLQSPTIHKIAKALEKSTKSCLRVKG